MPVRLDASAPDFAQQLRTLLDRRRDEEGDAERIAAEITARVRVEGNAALIDYTRRFDRLELSPETLRIGADEMTAALSRCRPGDLAALALARDRIEDYHRRQLPQDADYRDNAGVRLGCALAADRGWSGFMCRGYRRLSELGPDECCAGKSRRCRAIGDGRADRRTGP